MERRARPAERGARPKEAPKLTLGAKARKPEKGFEQRGGRTPDQSPDGDSPEIESVSEAWVSLRRPNCFGGEAADQTLIGG